MITTRNDWIVFIIILCCAPRGRRGGTRDGESESVASPLNYDYESMKCCTTSSLYSTQTHLWTPCREGEGSWGQRRIGCTRREREREIGNFLFCSDPLTVAK